jgi:hypothetical protein
VFGVALALSVVTTSGWGQQPGEGHQSCDRACLLEVTDDYLAALVAHDPGDVRIAADARFVENTIAVRVGEGLWRTASAEPDMFKIYVPDPLAQQVGFIGVMGDKGAPVLIALRLKLSAGEITEIEHLIARNLGERNLANLQMPRQAFVTTVPVEQRMAREQLLAIAATYYDALDDNDGSLAPFATDCVRRENGIQTTGNPPPAELGLGTFGAMSCAAQLDTQVMSYIDSIDHRRVEIADPETGLVFGLSHFRHSMTQKTLKIIGVPGIETWQMAFDAFDLPAAHVYKITGGQIHEVEALGFRAPYDSSTGWE